MKTYLMALSLVLSLANSGCNALGERDAGGRISDYTERANAATSVVHIAGQCLSACTIKLGSAKGVCIEPDAVLGFHSASHTNMPDGNPWANMSPESNQILMRYYSKFPKLAAVVAPMLATPAMSFLNAQQLIALGVPSCKGN